MECAKELGNTKVVHVKKVSKAEMAIYPELTNMDKQQPVKKKS